MTFLSLNTFPEVEMSHQMIQCWWWINVKNLQPNFKIAAESLKLN